jgi:uncharacterized repeat protein (TIGR03803 family)
MKIAMLGKRQLVTLSALTLAALSALLPLAARPAQARTETILYNFGGEGGALPQGNLTSHGGNLYGTTTEGGPYGGGGTVFELSPNGSGGWNETVLHSFQNSGAGGSLPGPSVIFDSAGNLYGTAANGGEYGGGVMFELSPVGTSWTETVLYNFCSAANCTDGGEPHAGLIPGTAGNFYGTTWKGGAYSGGTVFELRPSGSDWIEHVIYSATDYILDEVTMDAAGNIFGHTYSTVFELSPGTNGGWNPSVIHTFGSGTDGKAPVGTPVLDSAGNLYGATLYGGANGFGTVYKLSHRKKGTWTEQILHSFKGGRKDGQGPFAGIVFGTFGKIYGTTAFGGEFGYRQGGYGTVFELVPPAGKGKYEEKVLWSFNITDGEYPYGSLILDSAGNLYGTAASGGSSGVGVVFEVTPEGAR